MSTPGPRRSDATINRERLIAQADALFRSGTEPITLEMIAKAAGVGIGTLYRHFPTRDALAAAVYRLELDDLAMQADALLQNGTAFAAMRQWIGRYIEFVAAKRAMHDALRVAIAPNSSASLVRPRVNAIVGKFLEAGARDGTLRRGLLPEDVTLGLVGMVLAAGAAVDHAQASRILELLMAGLRSAPALPG